MRITIEDTPRAHKTRRDPKRRHDPGQLRGEGATVEYLSTSKGAFTKVTLRNGFSELFAGRLPKHQAVKNTLHQWDKQMLERSYVKRDPSRPRGPRTGKIVEVVQTRYPGGRVRSRVHTLSRFGRKSVYEGPSRSRGIQKLWGQARRQGVPIMKPLKAVMVKDPGYEEDRVAFYRRVLGDARYAEQHRFPKWNRPVNVLHEPRLFPRVFPELTRADHARLAAQFEKKAHTVRAQHSKWVRRGESLYGRHGSVISGGFHDDWPESVKETIRRLAHGGSLLSDAAHAHRRAMKLRSLKGELDPGHRHHKHCGCKHAVVARDPGSLYDELKAAGLQVDHHESDLYVEATPVARVIINHHPFAKKHAKTFRDNRTGKPWIEIPFAYEPHFARRDPVRKSRRDPRKSPERAGAQYAKEQLSGEYFMHWVHDQMVEAQRMREENPASVIPLETKAGYQKLARNMFQDLYYDIARELNPRDYGHEDSKAFFTGLRNELHKASRVNWLAGKVRRIDRQLRGKGKGDPTRKRRLRLPHRDPHRTAIVKHDPKCPTGMHVQSLLFARKNFDQAAAKSWAKSHGYKAAKVDSKEHTLRIRQHPPTRFRAGSFRTIAFASDVRAVVGCPK